MSINHMKKRFYAFIALNLIFYVTFAALLIYRYRFCHPGLIFMGASNEHLQNFGAHRRQNSIIAHTPASVTSTSHSV